MVRTFLAAAALVAVIAVPNIASADPDSAGNAAAGAAVGAGTGFLVGGPIGAAVGAGVGGTVGAASTPERRERVIIDGRGGTPVHERSCVRDSMGNVVCEEMRR